MFKDNGLQAESIAAIEGLKKTFGREMPQEYKQLLETPEIPDAGPSSFGSISDIFTSESLAKKLTDSEADLPEAITEEDLTEFGKVLHERLRGQTLIDLGCGTQRWIEYMARQFGCKRYIGVDLGVVEETYEKYNDFDSFHLKGNLLEFVSRLPDDYASFFAAGLEDMSGEFRQEWYSDDPADIDVVLDPSPYMVALLREIYRATAQSGIFIEGGNNSFPNTDTVGYHHLEIPRNKPEFFATHISIKE